MNKLAGYLFILAGIIGVAPYIGDGRPKTVGDYALTLVYIAVGISFLVPRKRDKNG